ncbi:Uncharacterised protein [uncultured archaeon]|nr:Uncharacterised protein [uncultured archaeon]
MLEIHHMIITGPVDEILREGLKSVEQLVKEGRLKQPRSPGFLPDQFSNIYFRYCNEKFLSEARCPWVSLEVNPETTFVHNLRLREDRDLQGYNASRMPLAEYIKRLHEAIQMRTQTPPGKTVIVDCITAEPRFAELQSGSLLTAGYSNEILIPRPIIPASEFKRIYGRNGRS